jgi:hypothetical protein
LLNIYDKNDKNEANFLTEKEKETLKVGGKMEAIKKKRSLFDELV